MTNKEVKAEARHKLALNMHQAIVLYTIEFAIFSTLVALVVMSCMCLGALNKAAAIVMIFYGILLLLIAFIGSGMLGFSMIDFYLASYKCKPYNIHRLGDTLARAGVTKILLLNVKRVLLGFLLTLCFIVPGVFYLLRTSMAGSLLIANPKLKASHALKASSSVMSGKTGAYFSLVASMTGWYVLGVLTLGLGFIFIMPYINLTKTVYYKRNLQGDKAEYKVEVQPVSPVISAPGVPPVQSRPLRETPVARNVAPVSEPARPIIIDNQQESAIPPIDTLGDEDMAEMHAAMRDLSDAPSVEPEVQVVPEIPITPVAPPPKKQTTVPDKHDADGVTSMGEHQIDDSDLVEIVKQMTTREVDAANVMDRRIDEMFSSTAPTEQPQKNYMANAGHQAPDDFVTSEIDPTIAETRVSTVDSAKRDTASKSASDREFEAFMRTFDIPEESEPYKPHVRPRPSDDERRAEPAHTPSSDRGDRRFERSSAGAQHVTTESRADRVRREREERLNNMRK